MAMNQPPVRLFLLVLMVVGTLFPAFAPPPSLSGGQLSLRRRKTHSFQSLLNIAWMQNYSKTQNTGGEWVNPLFNCPNSFTKVSQHLCHMFPRLHSQACLLVGFSLDFYFSSDKSMQFSALSSTCPQP